MRRTLKPDEAFLTFWATYPRRVARQDAIKAWGQVKPDEALVVTMLKALDWQCQQVKWSDSEWIPYPATWLRGRRWEDEPPKASRVASVLRHTVGDKFQVPDDEPL